MEEADEMTYGAPARRRHRQIAFNKNDLSYTKVRYDNLIFINTNGLTTKNVEQLTLS